MVVVMRMIIVVSLLGACSCKCLTNWTRVDGMCYGILAKFSPPFRTVYEARQTCLNFGGDISDILNQEIYDRVLEMVRRYHPIVDQVHHRLMDKFYIGSNDIEIEEKHVLLSGEPLPFSHWAPGEPNNLHEGGEACIVVETRAFTWEVNGTGWADYSCCLNENIPGVLCQMPERAADRRYHRLEPEEDPFAWKCFNHTDDCPGHNCTNGATCVDKLMKYECNCTEGWKGKRCQDLVKCPPFPTWKGLMTNTSQNVYNTHVQYTCVRNTTLMDNSTTGVARCAGRGKWHPPVLDCKPLPGEIIKKIVEVTEAKNAKVFGTAAIVFLICQGALMLLMDLRTLKLHLGELGRNCLDGYLFALCRAACSPRKTPAHAAQADGAETMRVNFEGD